MSKRLEALNKSLENKNKKLDKKYEDYFSDVARANGQPLNDKRGGQAVLDRWDRKSNGIANQRDEIQKTKEAIEKEELKIYGVKEWYKAMPSYIQEFIDNGTLIQWGKHPRIMFVAGVEKARIKFDEKSGLCSHSYLNQIPNKEQYAIFRDIYNKINYLQKDK